MEHITKAAEYTLQFINQTNRSVFLTGKAGTGKTTLLKEIIATSHKNTVVVAPTGIAALNAGGVTIHSMFQLPFSAFIPDYKEVTSHSSLYKFETKTTISKHFRMNATKKQVLLNLELLIIDEVSMLRPDVLDAIDFMLQKVRRVDAPFGGVQVLFIGDLLQLPPVIKQEEWYELKKYYAGSFFFHSQVVRQNPPLYIELEKIYRQEDETFISILNNLRNNTITPENVAVLNQYVQPDFNIKNHNGCIIVTTHNAKADDINKEALAELKAKTVTYFPEIVEDFPEKIYPIEPKMDLKVGAQVMFIKNDLSFEKKYFNGKIGTITSLADKEILVHFTEENKTIEVDLYTWENIKYTVNPDTKEIEETVIGTYSHYPLKLAWAITVHKSQGLTFDNAALDVSRVFAPGQAYVALSRLRSLNGLILLSPIQLNGISSDTEVLNYANNKADETILAQSLAIETKNFLRLELCKSFDFRQLAQEWRNHRFSYNNEIGKTTKSKYKTWAEQNETIVAALLDSSQKFINQIQKICYQETIDIPFLAERCEAAYQYYFKTLDYQVTDLLLKIAEVSNLKKVKTFHDELLELEEIQVKTVLQLKKSVLLVKNLVNGIEFNKKTMSSDDMKYYKINKIASLSDQFKQIDGFVEREFSEVFRKKTKTKKVKEKSTTPKKTTIEITMEFWKEGLSIHEIAAKRKLTPSSVYAHFTKLIQMEVIELADLLPEEKISSLKNAFEGYNNEGLGLLKDKYGDEFSWDELRLYKASLK
ncbi:helix-turn-helix domain-containing protein [Flavobacterium urocaniciphilum]|uniref:Helix-turn-helix domain-containing protein n=1 Tax=Flavobacterium urocaniciphilum TaxID=1299341 RepID=A0A1H9BUK6_9FLAO|nr:helix-turn-helix domain-containing protein [Flavobacterium urocaniciphilum]SEP92263.1 Helix-turn-helix domain-containing protein [Flavobacterium urocaniciphilum]